MLQSFLILFMIIIPSFFVYTLLIFPFFLIKNYIINIYYRYCFYLLYLFNIEIYVNDNFNEYISNNNKSVLIANHLSELDYIFIFILQNFKKINSKLIFVMKNVLRYLFFSFGWGCYLNDSLFLKRNYAEDKKYIEKKLSKLKKNENMQVLIFPEGYIFTSEKFIENIRFCNENNIKRYHNLLHPRTKGCNLIQSSLETNTLYDFTILYDTLSYNNLSFCYNIPNIIKYNIFPKKIYINIDKYNIILDKNNYNKIFDKKDNLITEFYNETNKYFKDSNKLKVNFTCLLSFIFVLITNIYGLYLLYNNVTYFFYVVFFTNIMLYVDENFI